MLDTSRTILLSVANDLASRLSPARWDLSVDDVLRSLVAATHDEGLDRALFPLRAFLEATPSGAGLDLAYGTQDASTSLEQMCAAVAREIEEEHRWFADHSEMWASDLQELHDVLTEFDMLQTELERFARSAA